MLAKASIKEMRIIMQEQLITYQTEISGNVILFCRFLRTKGYVLGTIEETDALKAISFMPINQEKYFKEALKAAVTKTQYQFIKFDEFYQEFWDQLSKAVKAKTKDIPIKNERKGKTQKRDAQFEALKNWLKLNPLDDEKAFSSYSYMEILTKKNFSDLSREEMQFMMRLLQKLARKIIHQKSRLRKTTKRKTKLDLKRTIRANMRRGSTIHKIIFSERKNKKLKLVLLCDVSRSMDLYSRFFVHLIYAFQNTYDKIETFVFSTALHRVSEILDNYELEEAFNTISERVPHWSGGTTIGSCLSDFTKDYGYRLLDKKTIVFVLSDGWDTGNPAIMKEAMSTIYKKTRKVIWLNPLAGSSNFSPEAIGMKTALPYIDVLASAHNLESLKCALQQAQSRRNLLNG